MIGQKSYLVFVTQVGNSLLLYVGLIFTIQYLGPNAFGTIAGTMALVGVFNSFSDMGFSAAHIKRVSEGKDLQDCLSTYAAVRLLLTAAMVTMALVYIFLLSGIEGALSPESVTVIALFILYYVLVDVASIATNTFDAKMQTAKSQVVWLTDTAVRIPLIILVAIAGLGIIALSVAYVAGGLTMLVVALLMLRRFEVRWRRPTLLRSYARFAMPVALTAVCTSIAANINIVFVQWFGTQSDVAYYAGGFTLLGIFGFIGVAVSQLSFPQFSRLHADGDIEGIRKITLDAERYISMVGMPILLVLALFPTEVIVLLLGQQFEAAGEPMRLLAIAGFIGMLSQAGMAQVNAVNRPGTLAKIASVTLALNVLLLLVFVPVSILGLGALGLSYIGASIVAIIVAVLSLGLVHIAIWRLTGTGFNAHVVAHVACASAAALLIGLVSLVFPVTDLISLVLLSAAAMCAYVLAMHLTGELTKYDVAYLRSMTSPTGLKDYVVSEVKTQT